MTLYHPFTIGSILKRRGGHYPEVFFIAADSVPSKHMQLHMIYMYRTIAGGRPSTRFLMNCVPELCEPCCTYCGRSRDSHSKLRYCLFSSTRFAPAFIRPTLLNRLLNPPPRLSEYSDWYLTLDEADAAQFTRLSMCAYV